MVGGLGAVGSLEVVSGCGREVDSPLTISSLAFVEKSLRPVSDIVIEVYFRSGGLKKWIGYEFFACDNGEFVDAGEKEPLRREERFTLYTFLPTRSTNYISIIISSVEELKLFKVASDEV